MRGSKLHVVRLGGLLMVGLLLVACQPAAPAAMPTLTLAETATPEPSPTPVSFHLAADGSGDYGTLAEAIQDVPDGAVIHLDEGIFFVEEPLDIDKPVRLVGVGIEETAIVGEVGDYVVRFIGDGPFTAESVTFLRKGQVVGDVVIVEGGEVAFFGCQFAGGVDEGDRGMGIGLRLEGDTTGIVKDSRVTANASIGIAVRDQAQPRLESNSVVDNWGMGIGYFDEAGGTAAQNECTGNVTGFYLDQSAEPTLLENVCARNDWDGIAYWGEAGGIARENVCTGNDKTGIYVGGQAQPWLEGNACVENKGIGVAFVGQSGGLAHQNNCSRNQLHGIVVDEEAHPKVERNICSDNQEAGIAYFGTASGVVKRNECTGNQAGIYVSETASPTLEDNDCHDNGEDIRDLR